MTHTHTLSIHAHTYV